MSERWYPQIDYNKCIGCNACNDMCKHGVYRLVDGEEKPSVVYGNGCINGCHGCEVQCPVSAINYFGEGRVESIEYDYDSYKPDIVCVGLPKVAFVCNHNSCRSQMAEAIGKIIASDSFISFSAGTIIKNKINPDAVRLIKELYNFDMEKEQFNKKIEDIPSPDVVIFMGCNVSCPNVKSQYSENWGLDDPTGKNDEDFKKIINSIEKRIINLKNKLAK